LVLGIAEIGLAMNDYLAVSNAVRSGSREASTTGADTYSDWFVLKAVQKDASALSPSKITRIVIYKATGFGQAPTSACQAGTATSGVCNVYSASDMTRPKTDFGCLTSKNLDRYWCPTSRKITLTGSGSDYIGVWMQYQHPWLTKMFGSTKTLADGAITRLEPRTSQ
jgi:hypothetical protein